MVQSEDEESNLELSGDEVIIPNGRRNSLRGSSGRRSSTGPRKSASSIIISGITEDGAVEVREEKKAVSFNETVHAMAPSNNDFRTTGKRNSGFRIAEGVEIVEYGAFRYNKTLKRITFPSTLEAIDEAAFEECKHLVKVDLAGTHVKVLGDTSFRRCSGLDTVSMPPTLESIGFEAFDSCVNLTEIDLSETRVKTIGENAFAMCNRLGSVQFPLSLESICHRAFYECENLNTLNLPDGLKSIGEEAFYGCSISTLIIPESVLTIGESAFTNCNKLTCVLIPGSTKVHQNAFVGCNNLPSFMLDGNLDNKSYSRFNGIVEDLSSDDLVLNVDVVEGRYRNYDRVKSVQFEEGVHNIGPCAFEGCIFLEKICLPSTLMNAGNFVFRGCSSLKELILPDKMKHVNNELCADCTLLQKLQLPSSLRFIYEKAFENCVSLKQIHLPETTKEIHNAAFKNCSSLKSISLPSSVSDVNVAAFESCKSLEKVEFSDGIKIKKISKNIFYNCFALKKCVLPKSVQKIENYAFFNCGKLPSLKIHEGVQAIGDFAFAGCTSIEHIVLPNSTDYLGGGAFRDCKSLQTVTILNPNLMIGSEAFAGCSALEQVNGLPSSGYDMKYYIEENVFSGCRSLETPVQNEIHLAAEGKCWPGYFYPEDSHKWIKHKIDEKNKKNKSQDDVTFVKDYNGDTAFQCAVRGGAPDEYLRILASGTNKDGKTHLDLFAERYARSQASDFTEAELTFLKQQNSKLIAITPIGQGKYYLDSFELLLGSTIFDPRTVPEFIEYLNTTYGTRKFAAILIMDILMPIIRVVAYSCISNHTFKHGDNKYTQGPTVWFVLMYITTIYLCCREVLQVKGGFLVWLTDFWNWIDVFVMVVTLSTTVWMHIVDLNSKVNPNSFRHYDRVLEHLDFQLENQEVAQDIVILATFFVWIYAVLKSRVVSVQFAVFVSGIINIIYKLVPFLVVSFLMLGAFAQMYLIDNPSEYADFTAALWFTYSEFLAFAGLENPTVRQKVITGVFGFLIVILLLNVVIAVASSAWEGVKERGRDDFLLYRIRLFLEVKWLFNMEKKNESKILKNCPSKKIYKKLHLSPDKNYAAMWQSSQKFSDVLYRIKSGGIVLLFRIILNMIYIALGVFFGITLPRPLCKKIFSIDNSEAISNKCNELDTLLHEAELEMQKLEKIDKDIQLNPSHEYYHLVNCDNVSSYFELKKRIRVVEQTIQKRQLYVKNFRDFQRNLRM